MIKESFLNPQNVVSLDISPDFGWWVLLVLVIGLFALGFALQMRGIWLRLFTSLLFLVALAAPSLLKETRKPLTNTLVIVSDTSPSMHEGDRLKQSGEVFSTLQNQAKQSGQLDVVHINAGQSITGQAGPARETLLFSKLKKTLSTLSPGRLAGVIFLTDGQVHDVPANLPQMDEGVPIHALITGQRNERDRQVILNEAPSYGIVGETIKVTFTINDFGVKRGLVGQGNIINVTLILPDGTSREESVEIGKTHISEIKIPHAGQNVLQIKAPMLQGELSQINNSVALSVNGVRDRLRVLLVSGNANIGERTWRNFLKSDPAVDLVHFTILREPQKNDPTPASELSLIVFPFRELFQVKLHDFDLVIFDHYSLSNMLPDFYMQNVRNYVEQGGAILVASGKTYGESGSLYHTSLRDALPDRPIGLARQGFFKPSLTDYGRVHPVTLPLHEDYAGADGQYLWGRWGQILPVEALNGDILMRGADNLPLLILSHFGEGRVAHLTSDQIWLWSRQFEGGGPDTMLLKRLVHWLMKEPSLDETALDISMNDTHVRVRQRRLARENTTLELLRPTGEKEQLVLSVAKDDDQWLQADFDAPVPGVYTLNDGERQRPVIVGDINPPEYLDLIATQDKFAPLVKKQGGSISWAEDMIEPKIRFRQNGQSISGKGWIGLRERQAYEVSDIKREELLPASLGLILLLLFPFITWWREGRLRPLFRFSLISRLKRR